MNPNNEELLRYSIWSGQQGHFVEAHSIDVYGHGSESTDVAASLDYQADLLLKEIDILSEFIISQYGEKEFFVNVNGRAMQDNGNSPTAPQLISHILEEELGVSGIEVFENLYNWKSCIKF